MSVTTTTPFRKSFVVDLKNHNTLNDMFNDMFHQIKEFKINDEDIVYLYVAVNSEKTILIFQNFPQNFELTYLIYNCPKKQLINKNEHGYIELVNKIQNIINVVKPRMWTSIDIQEFPVKTRYLNYLKD